jgi:hypothetical protein
MTTLRCGVAALAGLLLLAGCSSVKPNPTPPDYEGLGSGSAGDISAPTRLGGQDSGIILGVGKKREDTGPGAGGTGGGGLAINGYLWRGALDTLSFMPLASADPFGGVIITDWYTPPTSSGERFKATAYILGRDLRSDSVRVNIFRQVLQNGQWVDAAVSPATVSEIEDKVLDRARKLRERAVADNG